MNLDDLKSTWKQQQIGLADDRFDEVASRVLARSSWFEKVILRRDLIETAAAIIVILVFGQFFVRYPDWPWVARLGMVIIMLGTIEIMVVMHWTRRRGGRVRNDLPLTEFCAAEIARVDRQIRLLRNVNWWYTGPILLGCCIFTYGVLISVPDVPTPGLFGALAVLCGLFLVFGWIVYRINQRSVRTELIPLRKELADIYESLVDDSSTIGDPE